MWQTFDWKILRSTRLFELFGKGKPAEQAGGGDSVTVKQLADAKRKVYRPLTEAECRERRRILQEQFLEILSKRQKAA